MPGRCMMVVVRVGHDVPDKFGNSLNNSAVGTSHSALTGLLLLKQLKVTHNTFINPISHYLLSYYSLIISYCFTQPTSRSREAV